ncbi:hypothetical protein PV328_008816 [Microctonus aethiopoides]|uniref:Uncharacterized protein n=1 Tax=Microctonus aethiopoides TaxID=144406 RepID=A0AA39FKD3_9HYME|nr:hypothetical protein PV328_008816 [Microctonus aethiopoides]
MARLSCQEYNLTKKTECIRRLWQLVPRALESGGWIAAVEGTWKGAIVAVEGKRGVITSRGVDYVVSGQEPGRVPSWVLR